MTYIDTDSRSVSSNYLVALEDLNWPLSDAKPVFYVANRDIYSDVCGTALHNGDSNGPYLETLTKYAASLNKVGWFDRLLFLFSSNTEAWLQKHFKEFLSGGRNCPEGTPGYEKFMLAGDQRPMAKALLASGVFHFDRVTESVGLDDKVSRGDLRPPGSRAKIARQAGYFPLSSEYSNNIFRNSAGDTLMISDNHISWNPNDHTMTFGASFALDEKGNPEDLEIISLIKNNAMDGPTFPTRAEAIADYLAGIYKAQALNAETPTTLEGVLKIFGYTYKGSASAGVVASHLKNVASEYDRAYISASAKKSRLGMPRGQEANTLLHTAAESYYLAAAAHIAKGDFIHAYSMFQDMASFLTVMGVDYSTHIHRIDGRLLSLRTRPVSSNGDKPREGRIPPPVTGLIESGEMPSVHPIHSDLQVVMPQQALPGTSLPSTAFTPLIFYGAMFYVPSAFWIASTSMIH